MKWAPAVGLEKMSQTDNRQRTENRQTEKAITEATLIQWITRLSGPTVVKYKTAEIIRRVCSIHQPSQSAAAFVGLTTGLSLLLVLG